MQDRVSETVEKNRLIVENQTDLPMAEILPYVKAVIEEGRISNDGKCYCYATSWPNGITVVANENKASDRLLVYIDKRNYTKATDPLLGIVTPWTDPEEGGPDAR
jgi:hypothetical protein